MQEEPGEDEEPRPAPSGGSGNCPPTPPPTASNPNPNCGEFPKRDPRPGGEIDESEAKLDGTDRRVAEILRDEGYRVKKLKDLGSLPGGQGQGQRTPDFEVTDPQTGVSRTVEVKQPTVNDANTILGRIDESLRFPPQSDNIVIDGSVAGVTKEVALEVFREVLTRIKPSRLARLNSLRIIGDDFDISTKYPDICF
ncbi:MAG: hypothetical protein Q6M54_06755 [Thermostichus sp. DRC_bins_24]